MIHPLYIKKRMFSPIWTGVQKAYLIGPYFAGPNSALILQAALVRAGVTTFEIEYI